MVRLGTRFGFGMLFVISACTPQTEAVEVGSDELADASATSSESDTSATSSTSDADTGSSSSESSGSESSGSESSGSESSGSESSTSSSDTNDTLGCELGYVECPDGACVSEFVEFGCCAHGGECPAGCEPQDADEGMGACPGAPQYAWTGEACKEVCPCEGSDCDAVYDSPIACYQAHDVTCGFFDFSQCPFDQPSAPVSIVGMVPGEPVDLRAGAFGLFYGKGSGTNLLLRFAADDLSLANYVMHTWMPPYGDAVLQTWADPVVGVQPVTVNWGADFEPFAQGTLTITELDVESPDSLAWVVVGSLVVEEGEWSLAGSFGLRHCSPLNLYAP